MTTTAATRTPHHPIDPIFFRRWSPRAFSGEPIPDEVLMSFFEAARWAPSAMNAQPWRFVYAHRGTPAFERFLSALAPGNQAWAGRASALVGLASATTHAAAGSDAPLPSASHAFDAGAAWAQFALQAHLKGWSTHAMGGFDRARAVEALAIPPDHELQVFVAVGRRGDAATLPDWARAREQPSDRRPLEELVREERT